MGLLGLDDVLPSRPRGMHHRTCQRLERLDEQLARLGHYAAHFACRKRLPIP
jgi:hypothetical protein